jgi:putative toxin-antitoxin system antitoxin component (TIGR02293 family)
MKKQNSVSKVEETTATIYKPIDKTIGNDWFIKANDEIFTWCNNTERMQIIRSGIPFEAVQYLSDQLQVSVKAMLSNIGMPQTTYNKRKKEKALLDSHITELLLMISELLQTGQYVFNNEHEKFMRWLKKNNPSMGGCTPESMLDTITGVQEVRNALNRIEFGNLA